MAKALATLRFDRLVSDIARLYTTARKAQVQFAWETGKRIVEEEQNGEMRAVYGDQLIEKLSEKLTKRFGSGFSSTTLRNMRLLYLTNKIQQPAAELSWTHHVDLMRIRDSKIRKALEKRAMKEGLGKRALHRIAMEVRGSDTPKSDAQISPLKRPTNLKLNTYSKTKIDGRTLDVGRRTKEGETSLVPRPTSNYLDLGFFIAFPVTKEELSTLTVTDAPSYTYAATVDRVVDGDTLLVVIEAGFGVLVHDKLRLRGINSPELGTPEGEKAKAFVESLLPKGSPIVLKTTKSGIDKYGRFVVDVFYLGKDSSSDEIIKEGAYLNQALLDKGLAVRMM